MNGTFDAVGSTLKIDGHDFVVVGVASEAFTGIRIGTPRDIWIPLMTMNEMERRSARFDNRHASWLEVFGRLKPDVTLGSARDGFEWFGNCSPRA
jgi:putative ABC transport system permease protein